MKKCILVFILNFITSLLFAQKETIADSTFVNLNDYSNEIVIDLKYATSDNFLKENVYGCAACYLRLKTVNQLIKANNDFLKLGYRIKIFDCYRPLDIQKKMFMIVPDPNYVADPNKGSIHNRGGAVDITLIDRNGIELKMGTPFDFFGPKSSHKYIKFSKKILANRKMLRTVMENNGFKAFESEWWHYNLIEASSFNLSNFKWNCIN